MCWHREEGRALLDTVHSKNHPRSLHFAVFSCELVLYWHSALIWWETLCCYKEVRPFYNWCDDLCCILAGTYEQLPAGYHHMYFNVTKNTLCMWAITILAVIMLYEATKRVVLLAQRRSLRLPLMALLVASIYPHYYTWWSFINMWNDDFYSQWVHQSYFSITEAVSTLMVFSMCDTRQQLSIRRLLTMFVIGLFHIFAGSWDQFVSNVLFGRGGWYQQSRDMAMVGLDLAHVIISAVYLLTLHRQHRNSGLPGITKQHVGKAAFAVAILTFIVTLLPWKVLNRFIMLMVECKTAVSPLH